MTEKIKILHDNNHSQKTLQKKAQETIDKMEKKGYWLKNIELTETGGSGATEKDVPWHTRTLILTFTDTKTKTKNTGILQKLRENLEEYTDIKQ